MSFPAERIRNFTTIAHNDHGKTTPADRILEECGAVTAREAKDQMLDSMDLERERGITIKAQAVQLHYKANDGQTYQFHLIDTPGHVDFYYEVSRSLAACEGALLVVDAAQGVEAQTVANCYTAIEQGLEVVPVLNKIEKNNGFEAGDAVNVSAKTGLGVHELLNALTKRIPPPKGDGMRLIRAFN